MASKSNATHRSAIPPGYAWASDVMARQQKPPQPTRNVPPVRLKSTLVFEMPKPSGWDKLSPAVKFQKKRAFLCSKWDEKNFTFEEDHPDHRKYHGRIRVRKQDYYTRFEAWDSRNFDTQYHNTMKLLECGIPMGHADFFKLQQELGIDEAELLHALQDDKYYSNLRAKDPEPVVHRGGVDPCPEKGKAERAPAKVNEPREESVPPQGTVGSPTVPVKSSAQLSSHAPNNSIANTVGQRVNDGQDVSEPPQAAQFSPAVISQPPPTITSRKRGRTPKVEESSPGESTICRRNNTLHKDRSAKRARTQGPTHQPSPSIVPPPSLAMTHQSPPLIAHQPPPPIMYRPPPPMLYQPSPPTMYQPPPHMMYQHPTTLMQQPPFHLINQHSPHSFVIGGRQPRLCTTYGQGLQENQYKEQDVRRIRQVTLHEMFTRVASAARDYTKTTEANEAKLRCILGKVFLALHLCNPYQWESAEFQALSPRQLFFRFYALFIKAVVSNNDFFKKAFEQCTADERQLRNAEASQHAHSMFFRGWVEVTQFMTEYAQTV